MGDDEARPSLGLWLVAALNAVGPGLAGWSATQDGAWVLHNQTDGGRFVALLWVLPSLAIVSGLSLRAWRRKGIEGVVSLHRMLAPCAACLALVPVYAPEVERARQPMVYALVAATAYAVGVSVAELRRCGGSIRRRIPGSLRSLARHPWLGRALLALAIVLHAAMMIRLGIVRHQALGSRIFDLGIFDNLVHHAAAGRWQVTSVLKGGRFTSAHCSPLVQGLGPIYRFWPGPETLIAFQAVWLALGAVPVALLAERVFRDHPSRGSLGFVFGVAWLCNPSLHGVTLFDFHALALAAPLMVWAIHALHAERVVLFWLSLGLLLLTREDLPLYCLGMGVYALALGRRRDAALIVAVSLLVLAIYRLVWMNHPAIFMPDSEETYRYANRFQGVIPDPERGGMGDIVVTVATNPGFVIQHALTQDKFVFALGLFVPSLGLALRAGKGLWPASFGLTFAALGSGANLQNLYLHYTVFLFPPILCAAIFGLARVLGERDDDPPRFDARLAGWCAALVLTNVVLADKLGALRRSAAFYAGPQTLIRGLDDEQAERYAWVEAAVASIPPEASVAATNALGPHVSSRDFVFNFRHVKEAEYLFIDRDNVSRKDLASLDQRAQRGELELVSEHAGRFALYRTIAPLAE